MLKEITASPMFGLAITCAAYGLAGFLKKKKDSLIFNPLVFSLVSICLFLSAAHISLEDYQKGGDLIHAMLSPVTCVLAITVYRRIKSLRRNMLPVIAGCAAGTVTAVISTVVLCRAFGMEEQMTMTILPRSVTGPFAIAVSEMIGGIPSITIACVSITGIMGLILSPYLMRILKMSDPAAAGVSLGTSCHALGTVRAIELGEEQAAMASLSMCLSGIVLVGIALFI
ncbi:MAG: LrgB family protein [Coprococcus sp.]|nr:LrgB family protein [Coprococcus sp.]